MTIFVRTKSGSRYEFQQRGDKVVFRKGAGLLLCGEVVKLHNELRIGGIIHIDYLAENPYCQLDTSVS